MSEPQKVHPTDSDEFVVVAENCGIMMLDLASSLATGQAVDEAVQGSLYRLKKKFSMKMLSDV